MRKWVSRLIVVLHHGRRRRLVHRGVNSGRSGKRYLLWRYTGILLLSKTLLIYVAIIYVVHILARVYRMHQQIVSLLRFHFHIRVCLFYFWQDGPCAANVVGIFIVIVVFYRSGLILLLLKRNHPLICLIPLMSLLDRFLRKANTVILLVLYDRFVIFRRCVIIAWSVTVVWYGALSLLFEFVNLLNMLLRIRLISTFRIFAQILMIIMQLLLNRPPQLNLLVKVILNVVNFTCLV